MAMTLTGTVKSARLVEVPLKKSNTTTHLVALDVADELGNIYSCQMWSDDPQHASLSQVVEGLRRQPVTLVVAGYTSRLRDMPDGNKRAQTNFVMTQVNFPNLQQQ